MPIRGLAYPDWTTAGRQAVEQASGWNSAHTWTGHSDSFAVGLRGNNAMNAKGGAVPPKGGAVPPFNGGTVPGCLIKPAASGLLWMYTMVTA